MKRANILSGHCLQLSSTKGCGSSCWGWLPWRGAVLLLALDRDLGKTRLGEVNCFIVQSAFSLVRFLKFQQVLFIVLINATVAVLSGIMASSLLNA